MIRTIVKYGIEIARAGLKQILRTKVDIAAAGQAVHGAEVLDRLRTFQVDLLLVEMTVRGVISANLIRHVRAEQPALPKFQTAVR